jgi:hypothetical protein
MNSRILQSIMVCGLCLLSFSKTLAQKGEITGRVIGEDGTGVPNLMVMLFPAVNSPGSNVARSNRQQTTDEEGNFKFEGLLPRSYTVSVSGAKGYVQSTGAPYDAMRSTYRVGEIATIRMVKGGVITGKVTTATGEPMIGVFVSPQMVRDAEGRPQRLPAGGRQRMTDDRGVYRLYGLAPGTYILSTRPFPSGPGMSMTAYEGAVPTYHPSATRDTAAEIAVANGSETTGVDIRYRGELGHTVSGVVTGAEETGNQNYGTSVSLIQVGTGFSVGGTSVSPYQGNNGFAIHGVTDGEYELYANRGGFNQEPGLQSAPRRVTVRGGDVTGVELKLLPSATIDGTVALESATSACDAGRKSVLEEISLALRREQKASSGETLPLYFGRGNTGVEGGKFAFVNLYAGKYFLLPNLPNDHWYVKSLLSGAAAPRARGGAAAAADLGQNGITTAFGQKISGVTLTLADGGSVLEGKLTPAAEGGSLPTRMTVHLIPAETAAGDQVLRFSESTLGNDRTFLFKNLAPGRYLVVARPIPDTEPVDSTRLPSAFDAGERAKLRKEAESRKQEVELKACQRIKDIAIRL